MISRAQPQSLMRRAVLIASALVGLLCCARVPAAEVPAYLPHYDLDIHLDVNQHTAKVRQRVSWINYHACPTKELVFNIHSHYGVPDDQVGFLAKMLEIMRMMPCEALSLDGPAFQLDKVTLLELPPAPNKPVTVRGQKPDEDTLPPPRPLGPGGPQQQVHLELPSEWKKDNDTALVVTLPQAIGAGETVVVEIDFVMKLPPKQGRWGQWHDVTFLTNWLPVLAFYDDTGWQPTPFIPWHQPWFNEAGVYHARVTLPNNQKVGCTGSVIAARDLGDGWQQVDIAVCAARDFALLASCRYEEFCGEADGVKVKILAFPEHEHYARFILKTVCEAIPVYNRWFGRYPYPEFTIAESYFGWNGNECSGLVMIDARVFGMPHLAEKFVDYLVSHEVCHQWWYNVVGTNGYCETFMDEAPAVYFSTKLQDQKYGHNNPLLDYPSLLQWLPSIDRENYRYYGLCGTIARGEACATVQEMPKFGHVVNLFSMCYDRGHKIIGMIENRLGATAFEDFMRLIYHKYYFRVLRVADFQHELEEYTGQSWDEFFKHWLYSKDMTDWCVEKVDIAPAEGNERPLCRCLPNALRCRKGACRVTVLLHQKAEYDEQTVLGFSFGEGKQVRVPIQPQVEHLDMDQPPATIDVLPDHRVRVEVVLPCKPEQITVDPDKVLVDPNLANNHWHMPIRWRWTPCYTFLDETDLTNDYDKWNVNIGPWLYFPAYEDPWFTRSVLIGLRAGAYRTQYFNGGVYTGYRTDYRDVVVGADALWDHCPWPHTQFGLIAEHRLATVYGGDEHANRVAVFGRYIFDYTDSLYLPPMHYVETFADYQDNFLPFDKQLVPGAERYQRLETAGLHYHIDYLTPYWDPEGGFRFDATYACGGTRLQSDFGNNFLQNERGVHQATADLSFVKCLPDCLGSWLSDTRLAVHAYGAGATLKQGEFFPLGGETRFRGFDLRDRQGSVIWGGTLEWRVPVIKDVVWDACDHIAGVRNIYLAAFYDVGDAYVNGHSYGPVAHALGGGLRADVAWFSFIERTILRVDIAKTVNLSSPVQVFFGVQHPF